MKMMFRRFCSPLSLCERKQGNRPFSFSVDVPYVCLFGAFFLLFFFFLLSLVSLSLVSLFYNSIIFFFVIYTERERERERERESLRARLLFSFWGNRYIYIYIYTRTKSFCFRRCSQSSCCLSSKGSQEAAFCALFSFWFDERERERKNRRQLFLGEFSIFVNTNIYSKKPLDFPSFRPHARGFGEEEVFLLFQRRRSDGGGGIVVVDGGETRLALGDAEEIRHRWFLGEQTHARESVL